MIDYQHFTLDNGLQVYVHQDTSTPMAAFNVMYNVGSRDESPEKTGFAHLFEHLMFGGSQNIPAYDEPLQKVGGENNAFTSPDITNYFLTLPAVNLETAFWLESDRMMSLSFDPKVLEVQRKVVIEEFKQMYLNQPYGDVTLKLREMAYERHPYRWPTIGKEVKHIEEASMEDVKNFFFTHYRPNNAVLVVAGNVSTTQIKRLSEKWFGPIPAGDVPERDLPQEYPQQTPKHMELSDDVPMDAIYKAWHMPSKLNPDYYGADLLSDILGRGKSSRLYARLVQDQEIFNKINAYITGSVDPGLLMVEGKVNEGISPEQADEAIEAVLEEIKTKQVDEEELQKVKNQAESTLVFSEVDLLNRAMNLAFGAIVGDPDLINKEPDLIQQVQPTDISRLANQILKRENSNTIYYRRKENGHDSSRAEM